MIRDKKKRRPSSLEMFQMSARSAEQQPELSPIEARRQQLEEDGVLIGDSLDGESVDDISAEIKRKEWDEFEKNDMPYILEYAEEITSGVHHDRAVAQARGGINKGFSLAEASQQRRDNDLGISLSDAVKSDRSSDLQRDKAAALVDAQNNASLAAKDRENALIAGTDFTGGTQ